MAWIVQHITMENKTETPPAIDTPSSVSSCREEQHVETVEEEQNISIAAGPESLLLGSSKKNETNFTWEHFFVNHCGILKEDALEYETHLISHRLSPEDTLLETMTLLVEYGRIPLGDKIKITKTIQTLDS